MRRWNRRQATSWLRRRGLASDGQHTSKPPCRLAAPSEYRVWAADEVTGTHGEAPPVNKHLNVLVGKISMQDCKRLHPCSVG